jgi:hypothetical protein
MRLIQWGNKKLGNMLMFNIPASKEICGRVCKGCYSYKAYKIYPNVLPAQTARYEATKQLGFVSRVNKEIAATRKPAKHFRVHGSAGEFYSQAYIGDWGRIAKANPNMIFYAYTKRIREFNFDELRAQPNFILIDSFHYGGINYGKISKAPKDAFICPEQKGADIQCGTDCTHCMVKGQADVKGVFFKQH